MTRAVTVCVWGKVCGGCVFGACWGQVCIWGSGVSEGWICVEVFVAGTVVCLGVLER